MDHHNYNNLFFMNHIITFIIYILIIIANVFLFFYLIHFNILICIISFFIHLLNNL